jgi:hypothetical protein
VKLITVRVTERKDGPIDLLLHIEKSAPDKKSTPREDRCAQAVAQIISQTLRSIPAIAHGIGKTEEEAKLKADIEQDIRKSGRKL